MLYGYTEVQKESNDDFSNWLFQKYQALVYNLELFVLWFVLYCIDKSQIWFHETVKFSNFRLISILTLMGNTLN